MFVLNVTTRARAAQAAPVVLYVAAMLLAVVVVNVTPALGDVKQCTSTFNTADYHGLKFVMFHDDRKEDYPSTCVWTFDGTAGAEAGTNAEGQLVADFYLHDIDNIDCATHSLTLSNTVGEYGAAPMELCGQTGVPKGYNIITFWEPAVWTLTLTGANEPGTWMDFDVNLVHVCPESKPALGYMPNIITPAQSLFTTSPPRGWMQVTADGSTPNVCRGRWRLRAAEGERVVVSVREFKAAGNRRVTFRDPALWTESHARCLDHADDAAKQAKCNSMWDEWHGMGFRSRVFEYHSDADDDFHTGTVIVSRGRDFVVEYNGGSTNHILGGGGADGRFVLDWRMLACGSDTTTSTTPAMASALATACAPVDCAYYDSETTLGECRSDCMQSRTRVVKASARNGGAACVAEDMSSCVGGQCPTCVFDTSEWSRWEDSSGGCRADCTRTETRARVSGTCSDADRAANTRTLTCEPGNGRCLSVPCQLDDSWTAWSACTYPACTHTRTRGIAQPAGVNGAPCVAADDVTRLQTLPCVQGRCSGEDGGNDASGDGGDDTTVVDSGADGGDDVTSSSPSSSEPPSSSSEPSSPSPSTTTPACDLVGALGVLACRDAMETTGACPLETTAGHRAEGIALDPTTPVPCVHCPTLTVPCIYAPASPCSITTETRTVVFGPTCPSVPSDGGSNGWVVILIVGLLLCLIGGCVAFCVVRRRRTSASQSVFRLQQVQA